MARTLDELRDTLRRIDRRSYKAYGDLRGTWTGPEIEIGVDRVQGDPFAAPSQLRLRVPQQVARFPSELFDTPVRRLALCDALARVARDAAAGGSRRGSGRSGALSIDAGGQQVIERTAVVVEESFVELRLRVGLPAAGRRILGEEARDLLCDELPELARRALHWEAADQSALRDFVDCVEDQEALRDQLEAEGLMAFVADGARLPRESGASDRPLDASQCVAFESPPSLRATLRLPDRGAGARQISGLGIPQGVTLIVGGGYHGKSTLLRTIERCVNPHVPGDGRERCASRRDLVKVRAEDGRRVEQVDISAFISDLPGGRDTRAFRTDDASGSTSQAAAIVEALEVGAAGLLLDEDTCATNFMVRDARMQALVAREDEPITPFVDRVRELYDALGASTLLVMGGSGDYFDTADHVIAMRDYRPRDATHDARRVAHDHPSGRKREVGAPMSGPAARVPTAATIDAAGPRGRAKIDARELDRLLFGRETLDLRGLAQLLDRSQTRAIGAALLRIRALLQERPRTIAALVDEVDALIDREGLGALDPQQQAGRHPGELARPRRFEIAGALNRLRSLRVDEA